MLGFQNAGAGELALVRPVRVCLCLWLWLCLYVCMPSRGCARNLLSCQKPVEGGAAPDKAAKAFPREHVGPVPISCMDVYCHRDVQGNKIIWVFTGDEQGMVKLWDATPFANHLPINHIPPHKQPCNLGSYNPRVRLRRVFAGVNHGGITAKERPYVHPRAQQRRTRALHTFSPTAYCPTT